MVCWRFAHLHGFTDATSARVETGAAGRAGQSVIVLCLVRACTIKAVSR